MERRSPEQVFMTFAADYGHSQTIAAIRKGARLTHIAGILAREAGVTTVIEYIELTKNAACACALATELWKPPPEHISRLCDVIGRSDDAEAVHDFMPDTRSEYTPTRQQIDALYDVVIRSNNQKAAYYFYWTHEDLRVEQIEALYRVVLRNQTSRHDYFYVEDFAVQHKRRPSKKLLERLCVAVAEEADPHSTWNFIRKCEQLSEAQITSLSSALIAAGHWSDAVTIATYYVAFTRVQLCSMVNWIIEQGNERELYLFIGELSAPEHFSHRTYLKINYSTRLILGEVRALFEKVMQIGSASLACRMLEDMAASLTTTQNETLKRLTAA